MRYKRIFLLSSANNFFYYYLAIVLSLVGKSQQQATRNLLGKPGEGYYIEVSIGIPPQIFNVLVDTGSTNFAIAAAPNINVDSYFMMSNSTTYKSHNKKVSVLYTQGHWDGELGRDFLQFPKLNVSKVECDIAAIQVSHNFYMNGSQWQGILGLAYPIIARPDRTVQSWLEALKDLSKSNIVFFLELCGSEQGQGYHTGSLGIVKDDSNAIQVLTSPLLREWFYELTLTGMKVGDTLIDLPCKNLNMDKTIVDSGTTNLRLPSKVFSEVIDLLNMSITHHELSESDDFWIHQKMLCLKEALDVTSFPKLSLSLAHNDNSYITLDLPPESYIRVVVDNLDVENCYKFGIESSDTGTVLGVIVLEGFHVVFDQAAKTVGFAKSTCGPAVNVTGPFITQTNTKSCVNPVVMSNMSALMIAAYIIAAMLSVCGVLVIYILSQCVWESFVRPKFTLLR